MKKILTSLALGFAIISANMVNSMAAFAEEITLNAVTFTPKKAGISQGFRIFIDDINEKFKGEFQIKWRGGPEVSPSFGQAAAVRKGAMDMTFTSPSYYQGLVNTSASMNLSVKTYDEINKTNYYNRMTELHAERDLVFLGELPASKVQFHFYLRDPIEKIEDLKGRKIRVFPSLLPMVQALGAVPLVLPQKELITAMERGAIDGFMNGLDRPARYKGIVHHVVFPGVYRAGFPILVNKDAWAKVPVKLQNRLVEYIRNDLSPRIDKSWDKFLDDSIADLPKAKINIIELTDEEKEKFIKITLDAGWDKMKAQAKEIGADETIVDELKKMLVE